MSARAVQEMKTPTWAVLVAGVALNVGVIVAGAYSIFETKESAAQQLQAVNARVDAVIETLKVIDNRTWEMNGHQGIPPVQLISASPKGK